MRVLPVLQEVDGIYKTFYDEIGRRYVQPANPGILGLKVRSFATLKHLVEAFPNCKFEIKSLVVPNTKVAKAVSEDKVVEALKRYEGGATPQKDIVDIPEEVLDKLVDKILQKLEEKLVGG